MNRHLRLLDTKFKKRGVGNNRFLNDPRKALMIVYFKVHKNTALDKNFPVSRLELKSKDSPDHLV